MYVLSKVCKSHPAKLDLGKRSVYFSVVDEEKPTKTKFSSNYKQATIQLKEYRAKHPGEIVNIKWVNNV